FSCLFISTCLRPPRSTLFPYTTLFRSDIVTRCLFDMSSEDLVDDIARAMEGFRKSVGLPAFLPQWLPIPQIRRAREALETVDRVVYGIIDERRQEQEARLRERGDLLSSLVLASDPDQGESKLDRKQLRDEVLTLFLAGHETTSHALAWAFYLLSKNPHTKARLHDELDTVLQGRAPTLADLDALPYTAAVLDETLRLYPTAPAITRTAIEPTEIAGYPIAAGSEVLIWIYH